MHRTMLYIEGDTPIPEMTAAHFNFTMQALIQNNDLSHLTFYIRIWVRVSIHFLGFQEEDDVYNTMFRTILS
jgi:hypothetical protein